MSSSFATTVVFFCWIGSVLATDASSAPSAPGATRSPSISIRLPGRYYEDDDDDFARKRRGWTIGLGREFDLFDTRGGQNADSPYDDSGNDDEEGNQAYYFAPRGTRYTSAARPASNRQQGLPAKYPVTSGGGNGSFAGAGSSGSNRYNNKNNSYSRPTVFQSVQEWWTCNIAPTVKNWPRIQCRVEPTTTLKIRKTFRPLKTIVRLGADFNTQLGVWQFKSSWEDAIIGGKITLAGKELQLSKSWQLSVGTHAHGGQIC